MAPVVKYLPTNIGEARDTGLIPVLGRSPGVGNGSPFQYSCLENSMDKEAWRATVHRVTNSWTRLSMHARTHVLLIRTERGLF